MDDTAGEGITAADPVIDREADRSFLEADAVLADAIAGQGIIGCRMNDTVGAKDIMDSRA